MFWTCLCRNDKLVSDASLLSPLAYEFLRAFVLADIEYKLRCGIPTIKDILIVRSVNKVPLFGWVSGSTTKKCSSDIHRDRRTHRGV